MLGIGPVLGGQRRVHARHLTGPRVRPWTERWWSESDVERLQGDRKRGDTPGTVSATLKTLNAICDSNTKHLTCHNLVLKTLSERHLSELVN